MAEDATRITTFARSIVMAPTAEALSTIADPMSWGGNWESVGLYDQDVEIELTEERVLFKPHGKVAPIKTVVIQKGVSFTISLGETDLPHLKLALSSAVLNSGVLEDGGIAAVNHLSWGIETPNGVWHFKKGAGDGNLTLSIPDEDISKFELKVMMEADSDLTVGVQLWEFHDFKLLGV